LRREWGVAMDNRVDLPGYKCYLDGDGRRPAVFVCFLDVRECAGQRVAGVCLPVVEAELAALDRRERNYERVEVTRRVAVAAAPVGDAQPAGASRGLAGGARVWTYVGSVDGRARFAAGRAAGTAVIDAGYLAAVTAGLRGLGDAAWAASEPSLDPRGLPVRELTRRDLP
jgi:hypothetical protein